MAIREPFNLSQWIEENRELLKPPVGNKNLYVESGDYIVMIVAMAQMLERTIITMKQKSFFISLKAISVLRFRNMENQLMYH